jgi:uncharacterized protein YecE (DUF72 family)
MTAKLYIGTSGWSYPRGEGTWKGHFIPRDVKNELEFYSQHFNAVEINSSFYSPINPAYSQRWVKQTPQDFRFTAKLWQKFTHPKMFESATGEIAAISSEDVKQYLDGIEPIAASGKLGAILAQFPPSFDNNPANQYFIQGVMRTFNQYPLAVELRHSSWSDDPQTEKLFSDAGISWAQIDEPRFKTSIARNLPLTSPLAYLRFHGRNAADWWTGNNETRYKYLYSEEETEELAEKIKLLAEETKELYAFYNNHWQGYAPKNALEVKKALGVY